MGRELFIDLGAEHTTTRLTTDDSGNLLVNGVAVASASLLLRGTGAPAVAAVVGTLYSRIDAAANQLYVKETGSGTTGWQPVATSAGVFNVKDYGAAGDGVTADYTSIAAAIAAANSVGGGVVYFPPGTYLVGTSIVVPNNVRIVGCDKNSSIVQKTANIILFDFSGTSNATANRCSRGGMMDIKLVGAGATGALVRCKWADHLNFDRIWMYNNPDVGLYLENCWDTYFNNVEFDTMIGADGLKPAVLISSNTDDSSNIIVFNECRWENFKDGAVWISSRPPVVAATMITGTNPPYGIYFQNCKMESPQLKGNVIDMSADIRAVHIDGLYLAMRGVAAGGPYAGIMAIGADHMVFERIHALINGAATTYAIFYVFTNSNVVVRDLFVDAVANPTNAVIAIAGGSPDLIAENVHAAVGQTPTLFSGTWPPQVASATTTSLPGINPPLIIVNGTTTITSITAQLAGRIVTLRFSGILTLTDGGNLKLASNYVTTADDTITLISDGVNWNEIARSVN